MTPERIKELRENLAQWDRDIGETKNEVEECLDEIERLRKKIDWIAGVVAGMECPICKHVWDVVSE